ncbi:MAG TPA: hypothetical protein VGQ39_25985, partial [Pyrinomonadaceae bacterium]|nr:hypothetical protein [Pyrinomonadaceae bacterium]
ETDGENGARHNFLFLRLNAKSSCLIWLRGYCEEPRLSTDHRPGSFVRLRIKDSFARGLREARTLMWETCR